MSDTTRWFSDGSALIDTHFTGVERAIASYLLRTDDGLALVDPGPSTVTPAVFDGIRRLGEDPAHIRHLLATHIHLDHTGAAGSLLRDLPDARLYVHEVGAPHMLQPAALLRSATRVYGDRMERLWGEILPTPEDRTVVVHDGDRLAIGGREIDVLYTPGHASHHVSYHEPATGFAFVGDSGGIRIPPSRLVLPPTPPPDIDVDAWHASISRLRGLQPTLLLIAHFGVVDDPGPHLAELDERLDELVALIERAVADGLDRDATAERLGDRIRALTAAEGNPAVERQFAINVPFGMATDGLLRYLRKRDA